MVSSHIGKAWVSCALTVTEILKVQNLKSLVRHVIIRVLGLFIMRDINGMVLSPGSLITDYRVSAPD